MSHSSEVRRRERDADSTLVAPEDVTLDALASSQRRRVLAVVRSYERPVSKSDLATHLVARAANKPLLDVTEQEHRQVHARLHHVHLPKLASAGLVRYVEDGDAVDATHHPVFDRPEFDALVRPPGSAAPGFETTASDALDLGETAPETLDPETPDPETTDAVLSAFADDCRRSALSVLKDAGSLDCSELAERVVGDDADDEAVVSMETRLRHAHLGVLDDASLVAYDQETERVSYDGNPLADRWFEDPPGGSLAGASVAEERLQRRVRESVERADERLVVVADEPIRPALLGRLRTASERGVTVSVGAASEDVREQVALYLPDATVWEPRLEWLETLSRPARLGLLVVADREDVVFAITADHGSPGETVVTGAGRNDPLVAFACEALDARGDASDPSASPSEE